MTREKKTSENTGFKTNRGVDLEQLFRELDNIGSVAVSRIEPDWAKGHIRTVNVSNSEPLSVDWIAKMFGGTKLRVRVYGADTKQLIGARDVEIMGPPRDGYGLEIVRGPEGNAISINRMAEEQRRYNQLHGIEPPAPPAPPPEQAPQGQPFDMTQMFTALIQQQNQSNTQLTQMLVQRIQHLESMSLGYNPAPATPAPTEPPDPLGNLKNTVEVIAQLDAVKKKMGINDEPAQHNESAGYLDLIKSFMEIHLEAQRAKANQLHGAQGAPQLPPGAPGPAAYPPANPAPPGHPPAPPWATWAPQPTAEQLLPVVQRVLPQYLEQASRHERLKLAELVLGESIDDGDDDYNDTDDSTGLENDFENRQEVENALNYESYGEAGSSEENPGPCSPIPTDPPDPTQ